MLPNAIPIAIVGNKSDLFVSGQSDLVDQLQAQEWAAEVGVSLFEISAKNGTKLLDVFYSIGTRIRTPDIITDRLTSSTSARVGHTEPDLYRNEFRFGDSSFSSELGFGSYNSLSKRPLKSKRSFDLEFDTVDHGTQPRKAELRRSNSIERSSSREGDFQDDLYLRSGASRLCRDDMNERVVKGKAVTTGNKDTGTLMSLGQSSYGKLNTRDEVTAKERRKSEYKCKTEEKTARFENIFHDQPFDTSATILPCAKESESRWNDKRSKEIDDILDSFSSKTKETEYKWKKNVYDNETKKSATGDSTIDSFDQPKISRYPASKPEEKIGQRSNPINQYKFDSIESDYDRLLNDRFDDSISRGHTAIGSLSRNENPRSGDFYSLTNGLKEASKEIDLLNQEQNNRRERFNRRYSEKALGDEDLTSKRFEDAVRLDGRSRTEQVKSAVAGERLVRRADSLDNNRAQTATNPKQESGKILVIF